jgi:hypothetical protein
MLTEHFFSERRHSKRLMQRQSSSAHAPDPESSGSSSGRKRELQHGLIISSKRVKMSSDVPPERELAPMVQSGIYAAERMSHAVWIGHAINLLIVGMRHLFACAAIHC